MNSRLAISFSESGTQLSGLLRDQIQTARAACMFATETAHQLNKTVAKC